MPGHRCILLAMENEDLFSMTPNEREAERSNCLEQRAALFARGSRLLSSSSGEEASRMSTGLRDAALANVTYTLLSLAIDKLNASPKRSLKSLSAPPAKTRVESHHPKKAPI